MFRSVKAQHSFRDFGVDVLNGFEVVPVAYTSDIPLLDRWGTPLLFGPGSIHVAHTPIEYVDVAELEASVGAYERIVRTLLA